MRTISLWSLLLLFLVQQGRSEEWTISSPDERLQVQIALQTGQLTYHISYDGKQLLLDSPLGLVTNVADFSRGLTAVSQTSRQIDRQFPQSRIKQSFIQYQANEWVGRYTNVDGLPIEVCFRVSDHDVALRYQLPRKGDTGCCNILYEATGFRFPMQTTTFLTPQSDPMIGWKRTKPSYEEEYTADAPLLQRSQYGHGYTFPCLFRIGDEGWVSVSETGVDSHYCGSHLSDVTEDGLYTIAFPMQEENNGNGNVAPAMALPGQTPWRTLTIGRDLKPIVETTIPWSVVDPLYETTHDYQFGRGTWSWILWQDGSINYEDQKRYIDLSAAMGYEYVLIDNWWDRKIGHERMADLAAYAKQKNVDLFLWYSSSGYWNDISQSPLHHMDNPIVRKREMKWLRSIGVKGIKVDFFGGDKQETMRLYEAILSDADDYGLMVIFHGCTLPRGWERMYPNYVGSEAVLASENLIFDQHFDDFEAFNATLHPFIRNTVGCMEFGGVLLNKRHNRTNDGGTERKTTDCFQLATAILFQNPIQNFALTPNNLDDVPAFEIDFMKQVPTVWDEIRFIDGYPGKFCVLARRKGSQWYVAGVNAMSKVCEQTIDLSSLAGHTVTLYEDDKHLAPHCRTLTVPNNGKLHVKMQPNGGFVAVVK